MKKTRLTEDQMAQLAALDAMRDEDIDLTDIPELGGRQDWTRGNLYRPLMQAISIRLPAPDIELARQLAGIRGLPYQTYIKQVLHSALQRERTGQQEATARSPRGVDVKLSGERQGQGCPRGQSPTA